MGPEVIKGLTKGLLSVAVYLWLFIVGKRFNTFIDQRGADLDGFQWLLVVVGNLLTIVGIAVLDTLVEWNAGVIALTAFAASGAYMAEGAIERYIKARKRMTRQAKDDAETTLAE